MEFGKLENVDQVDFTLPTEYSGNKELLAPYKGPEPKIYVGGAKWGRKDWEGKLYPKKTKASEYLGHYAKHFNSIELNATHYNLFGNDVVTKWANTVGDDFKFCPKIHQLISHRHRLKNVSASTDQFLDIMSHFGDKLGTIFLQMPSNFRKTKWADLKSYLSDFPAGFKLALELRHQEWFDDTLFDLLEERGVGLIITDTAGERQLIHNRLTCPEVFIRFVGNNLHPSDFLRMNDWITQIGQWMEQGMQKVWFFIHQHDEQYTPELANYACEKMNQELGLNLKVPQFSTVENQGSLEF